METIKEKVEIRVMMDMELEETTQEIKDMEDIIWDIMTNKTDISHQTGDMGTNLKDTALKTGNMATNPPDIAPETRNMTAHLTDTAQETRDMAVMDQEAIGITTLQDLPASTKVLGALEVDTMKPLET